MKNCDCEGCELKSLFFENLRKEELDSVCDIKKEKSYQKGEIIFKEGDAINDFYYTKNGLVKLFKADANNREQIIYFAGPLDFISLLSIFSTERFIYSVVALEETTVCSIEINILKSFVMHNGKFGLTIIEKINKASDKIIGSMLEIRKRRLPGKIAFILLYFSEIIYKTNIFELPISRKEIAEFVGITTENVIRTLSEFRNDGIIKIAGKTIEITEIEKLKRISLYG